MLEVVVEEIGVHEWSEMRGRGVLVGKWSTCWGGVRNEGVIVECARVFRQVMEDKNERQAAH